MKQYCKTEKWDITNKPHTKTKIELLNTYIHSWFIIWLKQYEKYPQWLGRKLIIIDLFAGSGKYYYKNSEIDGSPLIFLKKAYENIEQISEYGLRVEFYFVEKDNTNYQCLQYNIDEFINKNNINQNIFNIHLFNSDCHDIYKQKILSQIDFPKPSPMFLFIDPYGIKIKNSLIVDFIKIKHKKDILFNFMTMGVQRVKGAVSSIHHNPLKTKTTLQDFLGQKDLDLSKDMNQILKHFAQTTFSGKNFKVIVYDMPYPKKKGVLYHLLLATKNENIINVAEKLFLKIKKKKQPTLFDHELQKM